jgi:hypothetical protein
MPKRQYVRYSGNWIDITGVSTFASYASAPASPSEGEMYYNTVDKVVYLYNGTAWVALGSGGGSGDITEVVAGSGLTGGATSGSATLAVGAGTGITVNADDVPIDTATVPLKSDNLGVFGASTSAAIGVGSIELGHASDTTLTRSSAGVISVEGTALVKTDDSRLTDARTPTTHATSHGSAGSDAITIAASQVTGTAITAADTGTVTSAMIANGTIVNEDINASAAIALSKLATDPLARANHTGTQTASTISDFDTQVRTSKVTDLAAPTASFSMNSQKIVSVLDPTAAQDAATKAYVDNVTSGINTHAPVVAASTVNISGTYANGTSDQSGGLGIGATFTATANGAISLDSVSPTIGQRVLLKNQTDQKQNGVYTVTTVGDAGTPFVLTRATDSNNSTANQVRAGDFVYVNSNPSTTANGGQGWVMNTVGTGTSGTIVIGTDNLNWVQFTGVSDATAGAGLTRTGNVIAVGAGTGITVNADNVAINTTTVPLKTDNLSVFAATTSSQLRGVMSDETGTGSLVFSTDPVLTDPAIGGARLTGNPEIRDGTQLRFNRSGNDNYVGVQASASAFGTWTLTLPTSDGAADQYLQTNGSGVTTWASMSGATVYYQASQPTGGTYVAGDIWVDSDDNTTPNTNSLLIVQKTASYTIASDLSDAPDEVIEMNVATANTVSIPTDATANYPIGTQIHVFQFGAGQTTIQAVTPGTTTVVGAPGVKLRAQYSFATIIKRAANYWVVVGDTAA